MITMRVFLLDSFLCMCVRLNEPSDRQVPCKPWFSLSDNKLGTRIDDMVGGGWREEVLKQLNSACSACICKGMQLFHFLNSNSNTGKKKKKKEVERKEKLDGWMFLQIKVQSSKAKNTWRQCTIRAFFQVI